MVPNSLENQQYLFQRNGCWNYHMKWWILKYLVRPSTKQFEDAFAHCFHMIVNAAHSKLHVCSGLGRERLTKCSLYSQFPYFTCYFSLFLHSRYLATIDTQPNWSHYQKLKILWIPLPLIFLCTTMSPATPSLYFTMPTLYIQINYAHSRHLLSSLLVPPDYSFPMAQT